MAIPTVYINLEDDVSKIADRVRKQKSESVVLVCPKRCALFADSINLKLLKKQLDLLGKKAAILTMDEKGRAFAQAAGFELKSLPQIRRGVALDIGHKKEPTSAPDIELAPLKTAKDKPGPVTRASAALAGAVSKATSGVRRLAPKTHKNLPKTLEVRDNVFPSARKPAEPGGGRFFSKAILGFAVLGLLLIFTVAFIILPKAKVVVYPKSQPITRDMDINLSSQAQQPDASTLTLPAVKVNQGSQASKTFESQGKKQVGNKATGTVRIYNFTRAPINLKAQTTTLTVGSKTYYFVNDALGIKPTLYKNAVTKEIDPASLSPSIQVIAEGGGESFDLPEGTRMEISNQVFGSRPQLLFAKIDAEVTGGTTRFLSVVSDQDILAAQTALADQALSDVSAKLKSSGLTLLDKAYTIAPISFTTDKPSGTESPSFTASLNVSVTGLAYNGDDLSQLIKKRISQTLDQSLTLVPKTSSQLNYTLKSVDAAGGVAVISAHFEGQAVDNISLDNIAKDLAGKSQSQANELLRSRADIDKIEITLSPSWQKNLPWIAGKISVSAANP